MAREFEFKLALKNLKIEDENSRQYTGSSLTPYEIRPILSSSEDTKLLIGNQNDFRLSSIDFGKSKTFKINYEVINSTGRTTNNKYFVEKLGNFSLETHSVGGSSLFYDTDIINREPQKTIFVNRFSAPGGPETNAELFLDVYGGEYSVYNNLNYRNLLVRRNLDDWWSETSSLDPVIPSYHKYNKNASYSIDSNYVFNGTASAEDQFIDDIDYDNAFIQHQIPQSDKSYAWIKNSLQKEFIFEPQYRNELENIQSLGDAILYDFILLDKENVAVLYFKEDYVRLAHFKIKTIGRSKTLEFVHEKKAPIQDLYAPSMVLLPPYPTTAYTDYRIIIVGATNHPESTQALRSFVSKINKNLTESVVNFDISSNPNLTINVANENAYTVSTPRNNYKYDVKALDYNSFVIATCSPGGDNGSVIAASYAHSTEVVTYGTATNLSPTAFASSGISFRPVRIFPKTTTSFVISVNDNQNITSNTLGREFFIAFTRASTTLTRRANIITQSAYFNNSDYKFLTRDSSNNIYYSFIADRYPQAFADSSSVLVGVLKIDSALTASRLFSQSVGTSSYVSPQNLSNFISIYNNNLTSTYSFLDSSSANTQFDVMYMYNSSGANGFSTVLENSKINISTPGLTVNDTEILYNNNVDYSNLIIIPKSSERTGSFDGFISYQAGNTDETYIEHVSIVRNKLFRFYVNEDSFNSELEKLWKKQLFKNYSIFYNQRPELLEYYYFNYKNQLIDPVVEFCGTNISVIKDFNEETNTISLSNTSNYKNLREYIANLNGFYGFNSWKQINNQNNNYHLKLKRKNKFFIDNQSYLEPVVTYQKPLQVTIRSNAFTTPYDYTLNFNYVTNHTYLVNEDLADKIKGEQKYEFLNPNDNFRKRRLKFRPYEDPYSRELYNSITYTEKLFPKNKYVSHTRTRDLYDSEDLDLNILKINTFWRTNVKDRAKTFNFSENNLGYIYKDFYDDSFNRRRRAIANNVLEDGTSYIIAPAFSFKIQNSIWSLDNNFIYNNSSYNLKQFTNLYTGSPKFLSKNLDSVIDGIDTSIENINFSSSYYEIENNSYRVIGDLSFHGFFEEMKNIYVPKFLKSEFYSIPRIQYSFNNLGLTKFYEPFGLYNGYVNAPAYNSYEDFSADLKFIGKDYSIIPEFNISEHLNKYLEEGLEALNKGFLTIKGSSLSSSLDEQINKIYSYPENTNSDYEYNIAIHSPPDDFISITKDGQSIKNTSSLSYDTTFMSSSTSTNPLGGRAGDIFIGNNGSDLYIANMGPVDSVVRYTLPNKWNISGAVLHSALNTTSILLGSSNRAHGIKWSPDGRYLNVLFSVAGGGGSAYIVSWDRNGSEWSLPTSTPAATSSTVNVQPYSDGPRAFDISSDGTKLFIVDLYEGRISQWTLTTPFNLTTISNLQQVNLYNYISEDLLNFEGMHFTNNGLTLYIESSNKSAIYQFSLNKSYDITAGINLVSKKLINLSNIVTNPLLFGLFVNNLKYYVADYNNDRYFSFDEQILSDNRLIAVNMDFLKDSQDPEKFNLSDEKLILGPNEYKNLSKSTSLIFNGNNYAYIDIKNTNNFISASANVTSPNLITSSFLTSLWFKIDKNNIINKKPLGLFSYLNSNDPLIYDPLSFGVIVNTSGSDIGDGTIIDTDIVVYCNGPHDAGVERKNILKYYYTTSSVSGNYDNLVPNIQLDENWHHLSVQYSRPVNFIYLYTPELTQKQKEVTIYPKSGLDDGYYRKSFVNITSSYNDLKSTLLTSSDFNYKLAVINTYGTSKDSFEDDIINKNYGISLYNLRGDKYDLLDYKSFTSSMPVYAPTSSTNPYINKTYVDIKTLGTNNNGTYFIVPYGYIGTSSDGIFVNYEYVFGRYISGALSCSSPKSIDSYKINFNNLSSSIYSFNTLPVEYISNDGVCDRIIIEQTYHSGSGTYAVSSSLFAYKINYANETLESELKVVSTFSSSLSSDYDPSMVCSLEIAKAQNINGEIFPGKSFIGSWYLTSSATNLTSSTRHYLFNSGAVNFTSTFLGWRASNDRDQAKLKYAHSSSNAEYYGLLENEYGSNYFYRKLASLDSSNIWTTSSAASFDSHIGLEKCHIFDDFYVTDKFAFFISQTGDLCEINTYSINTSSLAVNNINVVTFTSSYIRNTNIPYILNKFKGYNCLNSGSFNIPFLYFNTSSLEKNLTTLKFIQNEGSITQSGSYVSVYLDDRKLYGNLYNEPFLSPAYEYPYLPNSPYYNEGDTYKKEFNLDKFILGAASGSQFLSGSVNFIGELDELSLFRGHYSNKFLTLMTYNQGSIGIVDYSLMSTTRDTADFFNSIEFPEYTNVSGNIYGQYRLGAPRTLVSKEINKYLYDENFIEKYTDSSLLKQFRTTNGVSTHYENISGTFYENSYQKISLTVNGITKLLPYNGFYPAQRTAQIGKLFMDSLNIGATGSLTNDDNIKSTDILDRLRVFYLRNLKAISFLQPFMSPGILFNSIKSGIAVDWPIWTQQDNETDFSEEPYFYATSSNGIDIVNDGSKYIISDEGDGGSIDFRRVPFEALLNFNKFPFTILNDYNNNAQYYSGLVCYQHPTLYSINNQYNDDTFTTENNTEENDAVYPFFSWNRSKDSSLYENAINNFMAEIPRFFLKNKGLTKFISKPNKQIINASSGTLYVMDVVLEKDKDFEMIISPQKDYKGKYFGPPCETENNGTFNELKDPAYLPHVPPYFYKKSILRLSYLSDGSKPTVEKIIQNLKIEDVTYQSEGEFERNFDNNSLSFQSTAYRRRMPLTASITIDKTIIEPGITLRENYDPVTLEKVQNFEYTNVIPLLEENRKWIISTKWECPALNFKNNNIYSPVLTNTLKNTDISNYFDIKSSQISELKPEAGSGMWYGYSYNYNSGLSLSIQTPFLNSKTGSLANLVGFEETKKTISQIGDKKEISEAVIMIPYYDKSIKRDVNTKFEYETNTTDRFEFFEIEKSDFKKAYDFITSNTNKPQSIEEILSNKKFNSIRDMIIKMQKYEIPPHLDFLSRAKRNNFIDYNPFAMYIFEFKRELDKEDLAAIWQNSMPKVAKRAKKDSITIEHIIGEGELIKEIKYPRYLKWLIFKVKRKAEKFYDKLTEYSDERFNLLDSEQPLNDLNFNWPYDYFSLVELANAEVTFKILNKTLNPIEQDKDPNPTVIVNIPTQTGTAPFAPTQEAPVEGPPYSTPVFIPTFDGTQIFLKPQVNIPLTYDVGSSFNPGGRNTSNVLQALTISQRPSRGYEINETPVNPLFGRKKSKTDKGNLNNLENPFSKKLSNYFKF